MFASISVQAQNAYLAAGKPVPTVTSDKDDYAPGEIAIITGSGWTLDSLVDIHLEEDPAHEHHHGYHDTKVNPDGTWRIEYPIEERHLGTKFTVIVDGKETAYQGLAYFTDAINTSITLLSPASAVQGSNINITATLRQTNGTNSGEIISNVPVDFYINNIKIATVNTNSSGTATIVYNVIQAAGSYNGNNGIKADFTGTKDYNKTTTQNSFTVTAITCSSPLVTSQPQPSEVTYGDSNPTFSVTASGDINSYQWQVSSDNGSNWTPINGATSATYTVTTPTFAMNGYQYRAAITGCNTTIYSNAATLTVNQRQLSISVNPKTKVYGDPLPTLDGTVTGLLSSDNISVSYSSAATTTSIVGDYPITATLIDPNSKLANYEVTNTPALLTVTPATATLTLADLAKTYNSSPQGATVTTSPANLVGVTVTYDGEATVPTAAGSYQVVASLTNANYNAQSVSGTLVIGKATATVTLANLEHTYNGDAKSATATTSATGSSTYTITYDGAGDLPINYKQGGYAVVATLVNDNYSGSATGTLVINKADQVISWASPAGITYGTALSATQLNASVTIGNGALTYTPAAGTVLGAGPHTLTVSAAETNNYNQAQKTVQLNVAKATPTVALTVGGPYTYDGSGKVVSSATVSGVADENLGAATVTYTLGNEDVESPVNAGSYSVLATFAGNDNYTNAQATGTLVIAKADLAISAANATKVYGDANPAFSGSLVSGGAQGESFTVTASSAATAGSPIGDYNIVPEVTGSTIQNYTVTATNGTLTVTPRPITIAANTGQTKVYGDTDPTAFTYQISEGSLVDAAHLTGALTRAIGNNVGTYAITQGTLAATNNYTLTYTAADFTITRRAVAVTADALSKIYGQTDPELTYTVTSGSVVSGDNFTGKLVRDEGENVGDYAVNLGDLSLGDNYSLSLVTGTTFGITPKAITVTPVASQSKIYGNNDPVFSYTNTDLVGSDAFTGALARAAGENAGTYAILKGTLALSNNYTLTFTPGVVFTINPKQVTATISASDKVYDGNTDAEAVGNIPTGLVGEDIVEVTVTNARFSDKNAGTGKTVTADVAISNGNYSLSNSTASTTAAITAKPITGAFVAASRVYDGTENASASNLTLDGVITGDDVQLTGGTATFANKHAGVGKTVSLAGAALTGDDKDNYSLTTIANALADITPKLASVTSAANTKVYGSSDPMLTGSTAGFIEGDGITAEYTRAAGETVGNYSITATLSPEAALSNYSITYNPANFEITKALLTVKADDKSRIYGDANPQLTISYDGFVNSESESVLTQAPAITTTATITSSAGSYPISVSGGQATNYSFIYEAGVLTINKADISVVASDKSKTYGDENPAFTGTITGVKNGDAITANYSSAAVASSPVGTYDIVPVLAGDALSNYNTPVITNGTLTINKANLTAIANAKSRIYGIANPVLDGVLDGVKTHDNITANYSTTADENSNVGTYPITVTLNDPDNKLGNYTATKTDALLTISQAPASITLADLSKVYNGNTQAVTVTTAPAGLAVTVTYNGASALPKAANSYAVVATLNNSNYTAENATSTLFIAPKELTATLANPGKVYDGNANAPGTTATLDGVITGDDVATVVTNALFNNVNAGDRTVSADVSLAGTDKDNYSLGNLSIANATISPKEVTAQITAVNKVYDGTDVASATGSVPVATIVSGDVVAVTVSNAKFSDRHVGVSKAVNANVAISNPNYKLSSLFATTTADITPAPLTITAPSMSKYCGQVDPLTNYSSNVSGAVNNEVITTTYSINGTSVIPASIDDKLSNYTTTLVNGKLTINDVALDASSASNPRSILEDVTIIVSVKNGASNIAGVAVKLLIDGEEKYTATSDASGNATFKLGKLPVNVYAITASAGGCSVSPVVYLPVYDPDGGFVTGGGWINSPAGALENSDVTGKANFGFVAKYKKGKNEVEGNTEFQFQAGNINFKSAAHNAGSLVISGAKATYKGTGTIAGRTGTYDFMVVATDGQVNGSGGYDKFRIKIWNGGNVVYDNARGTLENAELGNNTILGGGSIVIHEVKTATKGSKLEVAEKPQTAQFYNYPNTFTDRTTIAFSLEKSESYLLEVYDMRGVLIKKVNMGVAEAGKLYEFGFDGSALSKGMYIARLLTPSGAKSVKMILNK
ncbi:MBG domain-containing protein [Pontibacter fetidus]|nr:MBG domain-containing protein [Pontibacter fetidus]